MKHRNAALFYLALHVLHVLHGERVFVLFLFLLALLAPAASAHEARPAYLEIKETAPGQFSVLWRTPVLAGMRLPVVLQLPNDVKNLTEPTVQELADSIVERRSIDAGPNGLAGKRIEFPGLQLTITDALVRVGLLDGRSLQAIARPSQPWVEIERLHQKLNQLGGKLNQFIQSVESQHRSVRDDSAEYRRDEEE
jgi:hypothetical protein